MSDEGREAEQPQEDKDTKAETEEDGSEPRYSEEDIPPAGAEWTPRFLAEMRESPTQRGVALVVAVVVGFALVWVHWLGLFVAGALVGLVSKTVPRAVFAGVVVGVLVLAVHVLSIPAMGAGEFVALSPPSYLTVAAALLMPLWGSLVRGVV